MTWCEAARAVKEVKVGRRGGATNDVMGIERSVDVLNGNPGRTRKL